MAHRRGSATLKNGLGGGYFLGWLSYPRFNFFIFNIKVITKIIIIKNIKKKNCSHVSAEMYHRNRCPACTPTPIG
jgi:hypothetical protein